MALLVCKEQTFAEWALCIAVYKLVDGTLAAGITACLCLAFIVPACKPQGVYCQTCNALTPEIQVLDISQVIHASFASDDCFRQVHHLRSTPKRDWLKPGA